MIHPPRRSLCLAALLAPLLALAGCAPPRSHSEQAQLDACRSRADAVYSQQNRGDVYRQDAYASGLRDTPFAGATGFAAQNAELSGRFARDRMIDSCMHGGAGAGAGSPGPAQDLPADTTRRASHPPTTFSPLAVPPKH